MLFQKPLDLYDYDRDLFPDDKSLNFYNIFKYLYIALLVLIFRELFS